MQIKTITTVTGANEIDFGNDDSQSTAHFYWFKNLSDSTLYVSAKPNPVAGADNVAELAAKSAASVETDEDKVYVLGAGKVEIHRTNSKFCPFELPSNSSGGGGSSITVDSELSEMSSNPLENKAIAKVIKDINADLKIHGSLIETLLDDTDRISNPNLLINPDFKINQRAISGTIKPVTSPETGDMHTYFVDRWGIDSGTVTINSDGTLTLNGTMSQILENAVGSDVTASVSAGAAAYDNATKTFTVTGNGDIISWAKLEVGTTATPFVAPNITEEQLKCQRYYLGLNSYIRYPMTRRASNDIDFIIPVNAMFRLKPTIIGDPIVYATNNTIAQSGFTFSIVSHGINAIAIRASKTSHGLTSAYLEMTNGVGLSAEI